MRTILVAVIALLASDCLVSAQTFTFVPASLAAGAPVTEYPTVGMPVDASNTYITTSVPALAAGGIPTSGPLAGYTSFNGTVRLSDLLAAASSAGCPGGCATSAQLFAQYNALQKEIRRSYDGTAIALALSGASTTLSPGKNYGLSVNYGTYQGSNAFGVAGMVRINDNAVANAGIGYAGGRSVGGRGGVNFEW